MLTISMLNLFLDSLEEGVLFLDKNRKVLAANRAAAQMTGREGESLIDLLCPSIFQGTKCAKSCELRGECALTQGSRAQDIVQDIVLERPDHTSVSLRMWARLLPPSDNLPVACAIILRDRSREAELEQNVTERLQLGSMVGHSPAIQKLYSQILRAAQSDASVLLTGESGTGKELVAKALHDNSERAKGPYVPVHCASLPENLLESELFGYAKGAFTGATIARIGRFEAADGGTLLLDEIGEIPLGTQVKLLRVLQEREVVRLGENHARPVNVRVIAATHRDLTAMVERGQFREDLYYRLRVLPLHVPPLRDRKEDISMLANKLLGDLSTRYKRENMRLSHEALLALEAYDWPGNIRQLFNALEYALVHADDAVIRPTDLPPEIEGAERATPRAPAGAAPLVRPYYRTGRPLENEAEIISRTLAEAGGNKAEAARRLGMSRTTLWKRLKLADS
ncbi:sigma-54 interaction domain-containing protein [Thiobacillus sedimenti]|uniref:Sigma 54-interacting transcriptional regulator n=1 Tax=Thiobacillus sedimenti TaxID=3110231 RepID=A0ABZ1CJX9_9PROT|nr:sigma 54-interacting transcriptional regulator [Thiobacillus sp. SCUT-2]WRS39691.1 sigma 54-interacting transcriptional regulator [Thiobacillus sp. SCUT-2]